MKLLRNNKGFTLIELISIMILLGVLIGIVVPRLISFDGHADAQVQHFQQTATDRYEGIRAYTDMETGLDAEGNDINEQEGRLTREK